MNRVGPPLASALRRMIEVPSDFVITEADLSASAFVPAVVHDAVLEILGTVDAGLFGNFLAEHQTTSADRGFGVASLIAWLLLDRSMRTPPSTDDDPIPLDGQTVWGLLTEHASALGAEVTATQWMNDPDRREELCRVVMAFAGLRPEGETVAQAEDRLSSMSSAQRRRLFQASMAAENRARQIRDELSRKAAQEAADKATRE
jgi:hypothetical protein